MKNSLQDSTTVRHNVITLAATPDSFFISDEELDHLFSEAEMYGIDFEDIYIRVDEIVQYKLKCGTRISADWFTWLAENTPSFNAVPYEEELY